MGKRILNMKDLKQYIAKIEEMVKDDGFDLSQIPVYAKITNGFSCMEAPIEVCEINPMGERKYCIFHGGTSVPSND